MKGKEGVWELMDFTRWAENTVINLMKYRLQGHLLVDMYALFLENMDIA